MVVGIARGEKCKVQICANTPDIRLDADSRAALYICIGVLGDCYRVKIGSCRVGMEVCG